MTRNVDGEADQLARGANALRAHCIEVWAALHSQEWLCYLLVAEGFYWV